MTKKYLRAALVGVVVAACLDGGVALAQWAGAERPAPLGRALGLQERPAGEVPSFMADGARRDSDEGRNPRRLSPEERRQLRRDVQDAGRDVYSKPPHHPPLQR